VKVYVLVSVASAILSADDHVGEARPLLLAANGAKASLDEVQTNASRAEAARVNFMVVRYAGGSWREGGGEVAFDVNRQNGRMEGAEWKQSLMVGDGTSTIYELRFTSSASLVTSDSF